MLQFYDTTLFEQMIHNLRRRFFSLFLSLLCLPAFGATHTKTADLNVLASIHPLALIAASVAPDVDTLLPKGTTPHDFSFRPSDLRRVRQADVVIWAGAESEPYLAKLVKRWPEKIWLDISAADTHDQHSHSHHHVAHGWLNPELAIQLQRSLAQVLGRDSEFEQQLRLQLNHSQAQFESLSDRGFFVFHRAYDEWVEYFGLKQVGAFTLSPEQKPGLKRLNQMRQQLMAGDVVCVFSEPQFEPKVVSSVLRGLNIPVGELDPLGIHISVTKQGYADFVRDLTQRFVSCLTEKD